MQQADSVLKIQKFNYTKNPTGKNPVGLIDTYFYLLYYLRILSSFCFRSPSSFLSSTSASARF